MTNHERPHLSLGEPPGGLKRAAAPLRAAWLWGFLLLQVAVLACLMILLLRQGPPAAPVAAAPAAGNPDELKTVAKELEEKGLHAQAARAWQAYLDAAGESRQRAEILYRIGDLYVQADQCGDAVTALVRAEAVSPADSDLKAKIGPKVVECLERLGHYGEVGRELSRRVEAGAEKKAQSKALATLGGKPLTEADLDRMIERRIDDLLAVQGASGDAATRKNLLKQLSGPEARAQLLQELLQTQLFCRRARELQLDREADFLQAREQLHQGLLARRFLLRELQKVQPTDVDIEAYYQANKSRYEEPESLQVMAIRLEAKEDPAAVLAKIKSADDFRALARQRAGLPAQAKDEDLSRRVAKGREDPVLGNTEPLFGLSDGQWTKAPLTHAEAKYLVLVEKKTPVRILPLAEIQREVQAEYMARKQKEVTEKLFRDLMARYDVQIVAPEASNKSQKPAEGKRK